MAPPGNYYLTNLEHLLHWVRRHHAGLLDHAGRAFIRDFLRLPLTARRLHVRLLLRRGPVFRSAALHYPEVGDPELPLLALQLGGFARQLGVAEWRHRLALLRVPELRTLLAHYGVPAPRRRADLLAACERLGGDIEPHLPEAVTLLRLEHLAALKLLFFGNTRQDLVEFILADLGVQRFEAVELRPRLAWQTAEQVRMDLLRHLWADRVGLASSDPEQMTPAFLRRAERNLWSPAIDPGTEVRRSRALLRLAAGWRRLGRELRGLACLRAATEPPARELLCRGLARLGRHALARRRLEEMARSPLDGAEQQFAARFDPVRGRCRPRVRGKRPARLILPRAADAVGVEQQVVWTLAGSGGWAVHMENLLIRLLVALGFWDVIFAPVAGAFVQPFQAAPRDLFHAGFRAAREPLIGERLEAMACDRYGRGSFLAVWDSKYGTVNGLLPWTRMSRELLVCILETLPAAVRSLLCDHALSHAPLLRRGFPDLLVLGGAEGCFEFVEVKGPGDVLRPEQRDWLERLQAEGLPARVLEVRWQ